MKSLTIGSARNSDGATLCAFNDWLLRYNTVSIAFCYRARLDVARLAGALGVVLTDFPAYAGRLVAQPGGLRIEHGQLGALLEVATSSEPVDVLAATAQAGKAQVLCPSIAVRRALAGRQPLLAARVTETPDGSVLGVTWHHAVGDLQSTMLLLRAWAQAYGNARYDAPPRVLDRAQYLNERLPDPPSADAGLRVCSAGELLSLARFVAQRQRRLDFAFGWDELAEIEHWASGAGFVSTYDALCAHAFSALRALRPEAPPLRLVLAVNYRKRAGLPADLLGNLFSTLTLAVEPTDEAAAVASKLRAELDAYATRHLDYHATRRFLGEHSGRMQRLRLMPRFVEGTGRTWIVSNWTNFGVYELAFDGALPAHFCSLTRAPLPWMTNIFESPNRSGITLSMHVPEAFASRVDSAQWQARMHAPARS
jgi:hypothetical protein